MRRAFVRLAWLCLGLELACGFNPAVDGPPAGNPEQACELSRAVPLEDTSKPDHIVGDGTPESCTGKAFIEAVEQGGIITFDCGPDPITIHLRYFAALLKKAGPKIVIDGGGKVALTSDGRYLSLYFSPCRSDFSSSPDSNCAKQPTAELIVQNLTFFNNGTNARWYGGGAIEVYDGRLRVINSRFFNNACFNNDTGGCGGAIFVLGYSKEDAGAFIVNSTFGGAAGLGNISTNGGAVAVSDAYLFIKDSIFSDNIADADFDLDAGEGLLGNGVGGAIYASSYSREGWVDLCGVRMNHNRASGVGGAIYFGGYQPGLLKIRSSALVDNASSVENSRYPGIFTTENVLVKVSKY